jgi:hypothetical protein
MNVPVNVAVIPSKSGLRQLSQRFQLAAVSRGVQGVVPFERLVFEKYAGSRSRDTRRFCELP